MSNHDGWNGEYVFAGIYQTQIKILQDLEENVTSRTTNNDITDTDMSTSNVTNCSSSFKSNSSSSSSVLVLNSKKRSSTCDSAVIANNSKTVGDITSIANINAIANTMADTGSNNSPV